MRPGVKYLSLIVLAVVFVVICVIPVRNHAADTKVELPGVLTTGQFGDSCFCPSFPYFECGCRYDPIN